MKPGFEGIFQGDVNSDWYDVHIYGYIHVIYIYSMIIWYMSLLLSSLLLLLLLSLLSFLLLLLNMLYMIIYGLHLLKVRGIVEASTTFAQRHLAPGSGRDCYSALLLQGFAGLIRNSSEIRPPEELPVYVSLSPPQNMRDRG